MLQSVQQDSSFEKFPSDWTISKVGNLGEKIKAGGTPSRKEKKYWKGDIPFVLIEDMTSCGLYLTKTKETITEEGLKNSSAWIVPSGSLLLSMYATIGETAINKIPVATNQAILAIVPKKEIFDVVFGAYLLKYYAEALKSRNIQSTQKNVNKGIVESFEIPLPPIEEQKKIAYVLSTIQNSKEKTEKVILSLRELKKSLMTHLFTYGSAHSSEMEDVSLQELDGTLSHRLWDLTEIKNLIEKTKQKDMRKFETEFKYVDVSSINRQNFSISTYSIQKGRSSPSRARKVIETDDVIIATVRPTLCRLTLVPKEYDGEICSTAFCVLKSNKEKLDPRYLFYCVQRPLFFDSLEKIQSGANYPAVRDSDIKNQRIPLPPLEEQKKIAEILSTLDQRIETEEKKKKALEELFKSMLHNLMTAKIRVKNLELEGEINV